jgi:hypothetical protein
MRRGKELSERLGNQIKRDFSSDAAPKDAIETRRVFAIDGCEGCVIVGSCSE